MEAPANQQQVVPSPLTPARRVTVHSGRCRGTKYARRVVPSLWADLRVREPLDRTHHSKVEKHKHSQTQNQRDTGGRCRLRLAAEATRLESPICSNGPTTCTAVCDVVETTKVFASFTARVILFFFDKTIMFCWILAQLSAVSLEINSHKLQKQKDKLKRSFTGPSNKVLLSSTKIDWAAADWKSRRLKVHECYTSQSFFLGVVTCNSAVRQATSTLNW